MRDGVSLGHPVGLWLAAARVGRSPGGRRAGWAARGSGLRAPEASPRKVLWGSLGRPPLSPRRLPAAAGGLGGPAGLRGAFSGAVVKRICGRVESLTGARLRRRAGLLKDGGDAGFSYVFTQL